VRHLAGVLLLSLVLRAEGPITRGRLLESDTGETGELSIRTANNRVYWYIYDTHTYVESDNRLSTVPKLRKGDELEIVSDTGPDTALRYARTIHVVVEPVQRTVQQRQYSEGRYALPRHPVAREDPLKLDLLLARGTLTFAGQICQLNDERFVLRTRADGEKTIFLRADTRFMKDGGIVPASELRLNSRVYVRGSKNLEGDIEAFQVIWGEIVAPGIQH
jgi:hypothetical protein